MKRVMILMLCVLACLVTPLPTGHARGRSQSGTVSNSAVPRFEPALCPLDVPAEPSTDCGYLVVPEDHGQPGGAIVHLPVVLLHSPSATPAPDPILYTSGGPGFSSLASVWWLARSELLDEHDVIILEQRGNRYAEPSLVCDVSSWWEERADNTPCLDRVRGEGIDLRHYGTEAIVADVNALRQALDYAQWNLYGVSYSSKVMLLTMQRYPEGIRSAALVSVAPPGENIYEHDPEYVVRAIEVMAGDCAADPACAAAYPDLSRRLKAW